MVINSALPKEKKQTNLEDQVKGLIREKVISGYFAPGEKLVSSRKIAAAVGTNSFTVHKAIRALGKEGLLISYPRRGTFVRPLGEKLTCVGVYSRTMTADAPFAHSVREMVKEELHKEGIEMDVWTDSRPRDQQGDPWQPFVKAAEQRRFQAFIGVEVDQPLLAWQKNLSVPSVFLGGPPSLPNNADVDLKQMVEISLRELARQGCRSVGFIAPIMTAERFTHPDGSHNAWFDMAEHFMTVVGELGLVIKNEWTRLFMARPYGTKGQERFGYEEFLKLWSQPEKPEGLVVFSDASARGTLMAIQEKQVRIPQDLKLILQKNENLDLFCPVAATFVVASEREVARALIKQIKKQLHGESCEPISLPFKIVSHINPSNQT